MWLRLREMLVKEFIQVFRDKRTRFVLFGPPVVQMVIFGYAATLEIKHVPMAILDYENSQGLLGCRHCIRSFGQPTA